MGSYLSAATDTLKLAEEKDESGRLSVESRRFHHGQAQVYIDLEKAAQARISNLLILAGLQMEGSSEAAREAATLLNIRASGATAGTAAQDS